MPIGGIGEIGGNNYLYSFKGEQIIVDGGISFADDSLPGVDITIPDPYIFLNTSIKPKAMILTHAHEDHVGGLEYYFDKINFPIYCNQFTFSYIKLIKTTYKRNFKVIFTGGYANSIDYKKTNFIYREDLTLLGIFFYHIFLNEKLRIIK